MSTKDRLAKLAKLAASVRAVDLAKTADISTKTVYRIRQKKTNPTVAMEEAIELAVAAIKSRATPSTAQAGG